MHFEAHPLLLSAMPLPRSKASSLPRTLLVLGRVSNLPTVWSNCLAGFWLGGGGTSSTFVLLCLGATLLYIGGMYLNDAFDADFDQQHRRERPIPSGSIALSTVWSIGVSFMVAGVAFLLPLGIGPAVLALLLGSCVVLYDAIHKMISFSPVLMAGCRFFLLLLASAAGRDGITGLAVWSAFALAGYIVGLSYVARFESMPGALRYWPLTALASPLVLAWFVNAGNYRLPGVISSFVATVWMGLCLRHTFWGGRRLYGRTVAGLLAGIVLVDVVALAGAPVQVTMVFAFLFISALIAQRFIPAT